MARCPSCFEQEKDQFRCADCGYQPMQRREGVYLPIGTFLHNDKYIVGKVLGRPGGFGITYLALDTSLDMKVAVKEYLPFQIAARSTDGIAVSVHTHEYQSDFDFGMVKFLEEAKTLAQFRHPNKVRVMNFFRENGTAYMVMDYLEGESLAEYLSRVGKLTGPDAVALFQPLLDGLIHIHAKNILHRDIKPSNIYLTLEGQAILLDFGSARQSIRERSQSLTTVVTPGFAPWEQYHRKGKQGPWTDIYACAATLYFMLTGQVPPDGTDRLVDDDIVSLSELVPGLDSQISAAVMQGLAVNPEVRPQTVGGFAKQLLSSTTNEFLIQRALQEMSSVPENKSSERLVRRKQFNSGFNVELKYFGEDKQFVKGECKICKRVLKIPWQLVWFLGTKLVVNDPAGIKCPCGKIYYNIEEFPNVRSTIGHESKKVCISISDAIDKAKNSVSWPFNILEPLASFTPRHRWGDTFVQWIKSPYEGIIEDVWMDKESPINAGVIAVIIFDQANNIQYQISIDIKIWITEVKISKGDHVSIGQEILQISTEKPLNDGEMRWFFSKQ